MQPTQRRLANAVRAPAMDAVETANSLASISSAAWSVASDRPPSEPRLAIERM